ncbi:hypothetical protein ACX0G9_05485 [Flavitalea flava]
MSFNASVIAKNGVAIISHSLLTPVDPANPANKLKKDADLPDTLFMLNQYTTVSVSENLRIQNKKIGELVEEFKVTHDDLKNKQIDFPVCLKKLANFLKTKIENMPNKDFPMEETSILITHYNYTTTKTYICKFRIGLRLHPTHKYEVPALLRGAVQFPGRIACIGQGRFSKNILGRMEAILVKDLATRINLFSMDLRTSELSLRADFLKSVIKDPLYLDLFSGNLSRFHKFKMNLPQAIRLATILAFLEKDFQGFVQNNPGAKHFIRLVIIDREGYKSISL